MLLLFPQGGGTGVVNYGVSDSLGVRIDEGIFDEIYIDTPDTLRVAISETSANATAFTRSETLGVAISEVGTVGASGSIAKAGTDTLSLTITDATSSLAVDLPVTDTLNVQISDASAVVVTQTPIAGADDLSVSLDDLATVSFFIGSVEQVAGDVLGIGMEDSGAVTIPARVERINFYPKKGAIRFTAL